MKLDTWNNVLGRELQQKIAVFSNLKRLQQSSEFQAPVAMSTSESDTDLYYFEKSLHQQSQLEDLFVEPLLSDLPTSLVEMSSYKPM